MDSLYFSLYLFLLCCSARAQRDASYPKRCQTVLLSDEVQVACLHVNFTRIPSKTFPSNTTHLSVHFSSLSSVTSDDLKPLPGLRSLSLVRNQLRFLSADLLQGLSDLQVLDLTGNQLSSLPPRVFRHSSLVELKLSDNLLSEVHADCMPASLQRLDLSSNRFSQLPVALLQRLVNLESLDFKGNRLEELTPGGLNPLSKLEALYLENNNLRFLDATTFSGNPNLQQLFLGGNRLESLPAGLFHNQTQLVFLDISKNCLQSLSPGVFEGRLYVVISGNPWRCDSSLAYLWRWLRGNKGFYSDEVTCKSPEPMKGRNITDVAAVDLGIKE